MHACSVAQSYPTLFNHLDYSQTGSSVHGILQTGVLEWDAISYSRDLPNPGIEPMSLISPGLAGRFFTTSAKRDHKDTGFGKHETIWRHFNTVLEEIRQQGIEMDLKWKKKHAEVEGKKLREFFWFCFQEMGKGYNEVQGQMGWGSWEQLLEKEGELIRSECIRYFPGGPVVTTPRFQCGRGRAQVQSLVGEPISHMPWG